MTTTLATLLAWAVGLVGFVLGLMWASRGRRVNEWAREVHENADAELADLLEEES